MKQDIFPFQDEIFVQNQTQLVLNSFLHWSKRPLYAVQGSSLEQARQLFEAPFVLLTSNADVDPLLNYGNQTALTLWEMNWDELRQTPGRQTAEPDERSKRDAFLKEVQSKGFIQNYEGIRVSKTGKRFFIKNVTVWNLIDESGIFRGQAAMFSDWKSLGAG